MAVLRLMGSRAAKRVDHRTDGDRHERTPGAHPRAGAPGSGRHAGAAVSPLRKRSGALCLDRLHARSLRLRSAQTRRPRGNPAVFAAPERLQPGAGQAAGGHMALRGAVGHALPRPAARLRAALHGHRRRLAGRGRPRHGHALGPGHGLRAAPPARCLRRRALRASRACTTSTWWTA